MIDKGIKRRIQTQSSGLDKGPLGYPDMLSWHQFNKGITVTGQGVSQWDDQSGNGNHLKQSVDDDRPTKEGDGSITFDGVSEHLVQDTYAVSSPITSYVVLDLADPAVEFTAGIIGSGSSAGFIVTRSSAGNTVAVRGEVGDAIFIARTTGQYTVIASVQDGANTFISQAANNTTGTTNSVSHAGFGLGARFIYSSLSSFCEMQVKELIIYNSSHNAVVRRSIIKYLESLI